MCIGDADAMERLGAGLAAAIGSGGAAALRERGIVVHLHGELGAGKTTLVRGLLHALGVTGVVRSPTYTLVEDYGVGDLRIHHIDLYRIGSAEEMDYLGVRDLAGARSLWLVEWAERAGAAVPPADLRIGIGFAGTGRAVEIESGSPAGEAVLRAKQMLDHSSCGVS